VSWILEFKKIKHIGSNSASTTFTYMMLTTGYCNSVAMYKGRLQSLWIHFITPSQNFVEMQ